MREEIERRWQALMTGETSREQVHDWTVPWVEGTLASEPSTDLMVAGALQTLHGFTMAHLPETPNLIHHGPPGVYVKSEADIRTEFEYWRARCREYDQDPAGYRQRALARGRAAVEAEMQRRRQQG